MVYSNNVHIQYSNNVHIQLLALIKKTLITSYIQTNVLYLQTNVNNYGS
jgi:hypothetical protein